MPSVNATVCNGMLAQQTCPLVPYHPPRGVFRSVVAMAAQPEPLDPNPLREVSLSLCSHRQGWKTIAESEKLASKYFAFASAFVELSEIIVLMSCP
eukprot:5423488-Amphidinium_carterae.1